MAPTSNPPRMFSFASHEMHKKKIVQPLETMQLTKIKTKNSKENESDSNTSYQQVNKSLKDQSWEEPSKGRTF